MTERLVICMRRSLTEPVPDPVWPAGIRPVTFEPGRHAETLHALLVEAYARGGGYVEPFAIWWPSLQGDSEYDPALVFVAANERGSIVGVAQCWTGAFVKDLAVAPSMRRNGLGSSLLHQAFRAFRERGSPSIELKVHADNPSGALRLYRSLGFEEVESYRLA
ncbi:GNAT family N-acetyltransferase [Microvirga splendida]|uniref:GNAT family N-acetyltransferase n=1 Tax=Microvirga splendida TaxID=2795727 RepID=A0ABS0Y7C0_9HYPH|nr:GNAT family N-acetyltransferase [Microvirga splendida]MBJ6128203.1 GNAT family N-acetyltransferase [Microvirga splendida]